MKLHRLPWRGRHSSCMQYWGTWRPISNLILSLKWSYHEQRHASASLQVSRHFRPVLSCCTAGLLGLKRTGEPHKLLVFELPDASEGLVHVCGGEEVKVARSSAGMVLIQHHQGPHLANWGSGKDLCLRTVPSEEVRQRADVLHGAVGQQDDVHPGKKLSQAQQASARHRSTSEQGGSIKNTYSFPLPF